MASASEVLKKSKQKKDWKDWKEDDKDAKDSKKPVKKNALLDFISKNSKK